MAVDRPQPILYSDVPDAAALTGAEDIFLIQNTLFRKTKGNNLVKDATIGSGGSAVPIMKSGMTLQLPPSFPSSDKMVQRAATGDIHTWLPSDNGAYGMFWTIANAQTNAPDTGWWNYIGLSYSNSNKVIIAFSNNLSTKNVYVKRQTTSWTGWEHIGDGCNASSLGGYLPIEYRKRFAARTTPIEIDPDTTGEIFILTNVNCPTAHYWFIETFWRDGGVVSGNRSQIAISYGGGNRGVYWREYNGTIWSAWKSTSDGGNAATLGGNASSAFATAAQGTAAGTAVQSATIGSASVTKSGTELAFPSSYPASNMMVQRPATGDIHTWLNGAPAGMYWMFAGNQSNALTISTYFYIGQVHSTNNIQHITCYLTAPPTSSQSQVRVKFNNAGVWSGWEHIGNGCDASTLTGNAASAFATAAQGTTANSAVQSATIGGSSVTKSGTQLQLPAYPTAASLDVEQESGTWTPVTSGQVTMTSYTDATWFRIGKLVYIQALIDTNANSGMILTGLPRTIAEKCVGNASITGSPSPGCLNVQILTNGNIEFLKPSVSGKVYFNAVYKTS